MINIAPLLPSSQPTSQSPEMAGASRGSETGFGKVFNETLSQRQRTQGKDPAAKADPAARSGRTHNDKSQKQPEPAATKTSAEPDGQSSATIADSAGHKTAQATSHTEPNRKEKSLPENLSPIVADAQTPASSTAPAVDVVADGAAQEAVYTENFDFAAEAVGNTDGSSTGHIPEAAASRQTSAADIPTISLKGGATDNGILEAAGAITGKPVDSIGPVKPDGVSGNAISEQFEASLQASQTSTQKWSDRAATPFSPNQAAQGSNSDQAAMPVDPDLPATAEKPRSFPVAGTPTTTQAGDETGNSIVIGHPSGKNENAATGTDSLKGDRTVANPAARTTTVAISINSEDPLISASTLTGQQAPWTAPRASHGDASITISGYFAPAKPQPALITAANAQGAVSDASIADKAQTIATSAVEISTPGIQATPVPGLAHLGSLAEKSQLHLADTAAATQLTAIDSRRSPNSAPLLVSLQELTTLRSPSRETREGLRSSTPESLHQQFKELALEQKNETRGNDTSNQQPTGRQETTTGGHPFSPWTTATTSSDQPQGFMQFGQAALTQGTLTQQHTAPTIQQPPAPAASTAPPMPDDQVFFQVAERFQLQMRNQETRLNIELHPADLGKLDINLSVKEGSIRAHVVAQSGQVRELLERNMTRLRSILENQGFSIEEILVSARSEVIDHSDYLQEQLARHDPPAAPQSQNPDTQSGDTLGDLISGIDTSINGVNITA